MIQKKGWHGRLHGPVLVREIVARITAAAAAVAAEEEQYYWKKACASFPGSCSEHRGINNQSLALRKDIVIQEEHRLSEL